MNNIYFFYLFVHFVSFVVKYLIYFEKEDGMKALTRIPIIIVIILIIVNLSLASEFKAKQPILITSAGQSADGLMVKILAQKAGLRFTFDKLAKKEALKDYTTLILVSGGSTKGLGAANIDKDRELSRIQDLIKAARKAKMSIITMHVGGKARRGKLSDTFNSLTAENGDCLIIVKQGDEDKLFSKIAGKKKIPIFLIDKIVDASDVIKGIFTE